jgi:hypothetical protein
MQELHWHSTPTLLFLIGGSICAASSFITTARVAWDRVNLEHKVHDYVSGLDGDPEIRISEAWIRPRLETWYSRLVLVLRASAAVAYGALVVSGYFTSGKCVGAFQPLP